MAIYKTLHGAFEAFEEGFVWCVCVNTISVIVPSVKELGPNLFGRKSGTLAINNP